MPSTIVHTALAGLIGSALLTRFFDLKAILVVMGLTAFIDVDTLLGIWFPGGHRTFLHTLIFPVSLGVLLVWDVKLRDNSYIVEHGGRYGVRVAWVSLITLVASHSLYDAFYNGVNILWPFYDRFFDLSGKLIVSDQRGIVQSFVELDAQGNTVQGTSETTHYYTGVDPSRGEEPENVERAFHVIATGERLVLTVVGFAVVAFRAFERDRIR
jgi:membrane-bound metal-dependent hydrolase YbcI (DUF457 family)